MAHLQSVYSFQHNSLLFSGNVGSDNDGILSDRPYTIQNILQKTPVTMQQLTKTQKWIIMYQ